MKFGLGDAVTSSPLAACTIVSKNYLPYARTLAMSFREHNPGVQFFVLLVDTVDGYFDPSREPFELVTIADVPAPNLRRFCFQYNILELNTAVKPFFLQHLFHAYGVSRLIYLDPDIRVFRDLVPLFDLLQRHSIVLTPHLTEPLPDDGLQPDDMTIIRAGTYNLGFIGLRYTATTQKLLTWWQQRLYRHCLMDLDRGYHVDQRWIDLIPGFYDDVFILRDPGYNVAYWNIPTRRVDVVDDSFFVNGQPGYFFHFSGVDPDRPDAISKHDTRQTIAGVGPLARLYAEYGERLVANGFRTTKSWPFAFGAFDNGVPIPLLARRIYLGLGEGALRFGDPFETAPLTSFYRWLNGSAGGELAGPQIISRLWHEVWRARPDLQAAFPDVFGADRDGFLHWTSNSGVHDFSIPRTLLAPAVRPNPATEVDSERRHAPSLLVEQRCADRTRWIERPFGINLAGHFASEKGVGEAARSNLRALRSANIPYVLNNVHDSGSSNQDVTATAFSAENPYSVNLITLGADQMPVFAEQRGDAYFAHRYNIGWWAWELADFPPEWLPALRYFDEIWTLSSFVRDSLVKVTDVPVVSVPLTLTADPPLIPWHQLSLGLPRDQFIFLFMFDFASWLERKNPLGLIEAFKRAFGPDDDVLLLLKSAHSQYSPRELRAVQAAALGANVRLTDRVLTPDQTKSLVSLADCYVSLHRAEGFGLGMAEAMSLGKPVIATGYSGNMEFMTSDNSFPVRYALTKIERDHGPYKRGFVWAEPDVEHAAELLRFVYEHRDRAQEIGRRARRDVLERLSPMAVGQIMRDRLVIATQRALAASPA